MKIPRAVNVLICDLQTFERIPACRYTYKSKQRRSQIYSDDLLLRVKIERCDGVKCKDVEECWREECDFLVDWISADRLVPGEKRRETVRD